MKKIYVLLNAEKKNYNIGFVKRKFEALDNYEYIHMNVTKENINAVEKGLKLMKGLLK